MRQSDRLFINDQEIELSPGTVIALTFQINDISDLKDRQANFSNSFKVPKTQSNRKILGFADVMQSSSDVPYTKLPARIIKRGMEVVQKGYAIIQNTDANYNIVVYSGLFDFFESLGDKKLSDLVSLATLNHTYDFATVTGSLGNNTGYKYPVIDYGDLSNFDRDIDIRNQRAAVFIHTLIDMIITEAGYGYTGDVFSEPGYLAMLLPFSVNSFNYSQAFVDLQKFKAGLTSHQTINTDINQIDGRQYAFGSSYNVGIAATIGLDDDSTAPLFDNNNNFNTGTSRWTVQVSGNYDLNAVAKFTYQFCNASPSERSGYMINTGNNSGSLNDSYANFFVRIDDVTSGIVNLASGVHHVNLNGGGSTSNRGNLTGTGITVTATRTNVFLKKGTVIQLRFAANGYFDIGRVPFSGGDPATYQGLVTVLSSGSVTSSDTQFFNNFNSNIAYGADIDFRNIMPDMRQVDFVKAILNSIFCTTYKTNHLTKTNVFAMFQEIADSWPNARDWSDKLHIDPKLGENNGTIDYHATTYARRNYLRYSVDGDDKDLVAGSMDAYFDIADETLEAEKTVIQSPFAATAQHQRLMDLDVALIRKIDGGEFKISTLPRILVDASVNKGGGIQFHFHDGTSTLDVDDAPIAYFTDVAGSFSLDYASIRDAYFAALIHVLTRYKRLNAQFRLTEIDINELDHFLPVYLHKYNAHFYLNKINNWTGEGLIKSELIRL